jgi:hypothetical protein
MIKLDEVKAKEAEIEKRNNRKIDALLYALRPLVLSKDSAEEVLKNLRKDGWKLKWQGR